MMDFLRPEGDNAPPEEFRPQKPARGKGPTLLVLVGLVLLGLLGWPLLTEQVWASLQGHAAGTAANLSTATPTPALQSPTPSEEPNPTPTESPNGSQQSATGFAGQSLLLSLSETGFNQLFSFFIDKGSLTYFDRGQWNDVDPALSPDGRSLAFASDRGGGWDLYLMDLTSGDFQAISSDLDFDASPTWSPDGAWLAYEHYSKSNLDIFIRPLDASVEPVRISTNPGVDFDPAWSPIGQQIAFVSDRTGINQIWLVDLEANGGERFRPLAPNASIIQKDPAWSPDGRYLAWSGQQDGLWRIFVLDTQAAGAGPRQLGNGEQPAWSPDGESLFAVIRSPNEDYLTAYTLQGGLALAPQPLPGQLHGLAFGTNTPETNESATEFAWQPTPSQPDGRVDVVALEGIAAPYPKLSALAAASFADLRSSAAQALGWDSLSNVENAFVPLTVPMPPKRQQDWSYTGRAFSLLESLLQAGWMQIVREDFAGESYWRVYLKAATQDGSLGQPMTQQPWNLAARSNGENGDYQAGGKRMEQAPAGYWIDFTLLAADFGWERLPALNNWRSYYPGALFNEFVLRQGLDWQEAMLQLYPTEAFEAFNSE